MGTLIYSLRICLNGQEHWFQVRRHPSRDPRFHVETKDDTGNAIVFSIVRTTTGHWTAGPECLPDWLQDYIEEIGAKIDAAASIAHHAQCAITASHVYQRERLGLP